ncbi:MAG: cell division topological specificity factor MinE [Alphaproteobacteria bacterium]
MNIFRFFRREAEAVVTPPTAVAAKERLQILLAHERVDLASPDHMPKLQQEILAVISKYFDVDPNKVGVKLERGNAVSTLEVNIELPPNKKPAKENDSSVTSAPAKAANG